MSAPEAPPWHHQSRRVLLFETAVVRQSAQVVRGVAPSASKFSSGGGCPPGGSDTSRPRQCVASHEDGAATKDHRLAEEAVHHPRATMAEVGATPPATSEGRATAAPSYKGRATPGAPEATLPRRAKSPYAPPDPTAAEHEEQDLRLRLGGREPNAPPGPTARLRCKARRAKSPPVRVEQREGIHQFAAHPATHAAACRPRPENRQSRGCSDLTLPHTTRSPERQSHTHYPHHGRWDMHMPMGAGLVMKVDVVRQGERRHGRTNPNSSSTPLAAAGWLARATHCARKAPSAQRDARQGNRRRADERGEAPCKIHARAVHKTMADTRAGALVLVTSAAT